MPHFITSCIYFFRFNFQVCSNEAGDIGFRQSKCSKCENKILVANGYFEYATITRGYPDIKKLGEQKEMKEIHRNRLM